MNFSARNPTRRAADACRGNTEQRFRAQKHPEMSEPSKKVHLARKRVDPRPTSHDSIVLVTGHILWVDAISSLDEDGSPSPLRDTSRVDGIHTAPNLGGIFTNAVRELGAPGKGCKTSPGAHSIYKDGQNQIRAARITTSRRGRYRPFSVHIAYYAECIDDTGSSEMTSATSNNRDNAVTCRWNTLAIRSQMATVRPIDNFGRHSQEYTPDGPY